MRFKVEMTFEVSVDVPGDELGDYLLDEYVEELASETTIDEWVLRSGPTVNAFAPSGRDEGLMRSWVTLRRDNATGNWVGTDWTVPGVHHRSVAASFADLACGFVNDET